MFCLDGVDLHWGSQGPFSVAYVLGGAGLFCWMRGGTRLPARRKVPVRSPCAALHRDASGRIVLGDIITGLDGKPVKLQKELFEILDECSVGQRVEVLVNRQGTTKKLEVVLAEREVSAVS
jgi:S1-C subfamily serine protease